MNSSTRATTHPRLLPTERVDPGGDSPWSAEHRSRYRWAAQFVRDKVVLDVACGTGYGIPILASGKPRVLLGIDRALSALPSSVDGTSAAVVCGDAERLPLCSDSVDFVVSFETIEHLHNPDRFLDEVARVLRADGAMVVSSPNGEFSRHGLDGRPSNPFHVREFRPPELKRMVGRLFRDVHVYGQVVSRSFGVCPFWEPRDRLNESRRVRAKAFLWKIFVRLPSPIGDLLARRILKQAMYPADQDFLFLEDEDSSGHVFIVTAAAGRD